MHVCIYAVCVCLFRETLLYHIVGLQHVMSYHVVLYQYHTGCNMSNYSIVYFSLCHVMFYFTLVYSVLLLHSTILYETELSCFILTSYPTA